MCAERIFRTPSRETALLVGLTALGLCVRLPGLSASFYGDEGFSLLRDSNELITRSEDRFRPLFFSLLYLWKAIGMHGEAGLRGLPLLFGVLQIPVAFHLGKLVGGSVRSGAVFGVLVALNPMLIEFSQELRMYSLVPLIALLQAWAFAGVVARTSQGRPTLAPWAGFVAAGLAGVYTHFHYWFLIVGFATAALRRRRELRLRQSVLGLGSIVLLYLPDIPNLLRFQREAAGAPHLVAADLPSALPKLIAAICVGFNYFTLPHLGIDRAIRGSVMRSNAGLTLLIAIPALAVGWRLVKIHARRKWPPMVWLAHELFTVPVLLSLSAVLVMRRDFIHPKYMVFSAPFLLLLLTAGYLDLPGKAERLVVGFVGVGAFAVSIVHFNEPGRYGRREDWRGAAAYLRASLDPDSALIWLGGANAPDRMTSAGAPKSLWEYYAADLFPRIRVLRMPRPEASAPEIAPRITELTTGERRVYYLWSEIGANVEDPGNSIVAAARTNFSHERRIDYNPRLALYVWDNP